MAVPNNAYKRITFTKIDGRCENIIYRQKALLALHDSVKQQASNLVSSLGKSCEASLLHAYAEVAQTLRTVQFHYNQLDHKTSSIPSRQATDLTPVGTVLVVFDTKFNPVFNALAPLASAIAAGNTCVLSPTVHDAEILRVLSKCLLPLDRDLYLVLQESISSVPEDFPVDILVVQDATESAQALKKSLLKRAASTEVIECYTGPCCAIIDRTASPEIAAQQLIASKTFNAGQGTAAPTVILVHEFIVDEFMTALSNASVKVQAEQMNAINFGKTMEYLDSASSSGSHRLLRGVVDKSSRKMGITVIEGISIAMLPGPKAPIITITKVSSLDDAIDKCNSIMDNRLCCAMYLFASTDAARYLSQFVKAVNTYVNYIPLGLLIGAVPLYGKTDIISRYTPVMFSRIRNYSHATNENVIQKAEEYAELSKVQRFVLETQMRPLHQKEGARTDFFVQGIKVMMGTVALSAIGGLLVFLFAVYKGYQTYFR